ncbi:MAG TPA: hypothetical protein VMJ14_12105 [Burkholderiales bacterium]|nr:hypothetical protein [Burkholderiales bacterium]
MSGVSEDTGTLAVLAKRMVEERLPKALALKERVDKGGLLNDLDLNFLEQVVKDAQSIRPLLKDNQRLTDVAASMLRLYKEISDKALENEKTRK